LEDLLNEIQAKEKKSVQGKGNDTENQKENHLVNYNVMIEVFKTDVRDSAEANRLVLEIDTRFSGCAANFDLSDCDRILRIKHPSTVEPCPIY
jgi:hypothetical protein